VIALAEQVVIEVLKKEVVVVIIGATNGCVEIFAFDAPAIEESPFDATADCVAEQPTVAVVDVVGALKWIKSATSTQ
jgi:hypothetical protein